MQALCARGCVLLIFASRNLLNSATNEMNIIHLCSQLVHVHVGHELEAFSPQMNESQTTASKNEIDDSVESASAVKTQRCISGCKSIRRECPLTLLPLWLQTQVRNLR